MTPDTSPSPVALRAAKRLIQSIPRASSGVIAVWNAGGYPLISDSGFATKRLADDQVGYVQEAVARVIDAETGLPELLAAMKAVLDLDSEEPNDRYRPRVAGGRAGKHLRDT